MKKPKTKCIRIWCEEELYERWWRYAEKYRNQAIALTKLLELVEKKRKPRY